MNITDTISHARSAVFEVIKYLNKRKTNMEKFGFAISEGRQIDWDSNDRSIADYIRNGTKLYGLHCMRRLFSDLHCR